MASQLLLMHPGRCGSHTDKSGCSSTVFLVQQKASCLQSVEGRVNARFPEQLQAKTEKPEILGDSLTSFLTKCHEGLEANKRQRNKPGCCCKAFIEGRRKEDTKQQSTLPPTPSPAPQAPPPTGDGEGQIRGFNGRGSEPFARGAGGRQALSCG